MGKRENNPILLKLSPVVKGIAKTFAKDCEALLHDANNLENSIVMIENAHVTGRKVGSPEKIPHSFKYDYLFK